MSPDGNNPHMMAGDSGSPSSGFLNENTGRLVHELRELVHDQLELVTLEAKLSINTLLRMAIVGMVTAVVLTSVWLALMASAALALVTSGLAPGLAMLVVAAANLALAAGGWLWLSHMSQSLGWPTTQRGLKPPAVDEEQRSDR